MNRVVLSSVKQDYITPPSWVELVKLVGGGQIALDPSTDETNPCGAEQIFTKQTDGLTKDWREWARGGLTYSNCEYGDALDEWSRKFSDEGPRLKGGLITLTPSRTGTRWFRRKMVTADALCFVTGRITFWSTHPETGKLEPHVTKETVLDEKTGKRVWTGRWKVTPAPFDSLFAYWGPKPDRFREVFGSYGWCPL